MIKISTLITNMILKKVDEKEKEKGKYTYNMRELRDEIKGDV